LLAQKLERFLYCRAEGISAVTKSFCEHIRQVVSETRAVELVMNGTVPETFNKDGRRGEVRAKLKIDDRFFVLFAGNLGLAQGLHHIVEAAAKLSAQHSDVLFLFLGSGPLKERLVEDVALRGLENVRFLPRTTLEDAAAHMAAADALLVSLNDHSIYRKFIPSKLFDCMAAGRPVLLSVDGEARSILEAADAGIYYPAENGAGLEKAVVKLKKDPAAASRMGRNGRRYASAQCTREEQARVMTSFLQQIVENPKERTDARA
jgi:glycosyltransferase involved in cell wall biosynthesis